jgi:hypothetical protein
MAAGGMLPVPVAVPCAQPQTSGEGSVQFFFHATGILLSTILYGRRREWPGARSGQDHTEQWSGRRGDSDAEPQLATQWHCAGVCGPADGAIPDARERRRSPVWRRAQRGVFPVLPVNIILGMSVRGSATSPCFLFQATEVW